MKRADLLARQIALNFDASVTVVAQPDLPYLLNGPDLLLAVPGFLVAAYVVKVAESSRPYLLRSRLLASKLALASSTAHVLLTRDNASVKSTRDFDETFRASDRRSLGQYLHFRPRPSSNDDGVRHLAHRRFSLVYYAARQLSESRVLDRYEARRQGRRKRRPKRGSASGKRAARIQQSGLQESQSGRPAVEHAIYADRTMWLPPDPKPADVLRDVNASLSKSFALDNGQVFAIDLAPDLLLGADLPVGAYDPLKPIRAAAFGGCVISPEDAPERMASVMERLDARIGRLRR